MKKWMLTTSVCVTLLLMIAGCTKDLAETKTQELLEVNAAFASKVSVTVQVGQSIQAAVDAAAPGTVIKIQPGLYLEAVVVDKKDITLLGMENGNNKVIIQNPGGVNNGITVRDNGDGFVLKQVTVKDFLRNGVFMIRVDGFVLSHVTAIDCGEYGLYPIRCTNGVMEHCKASGHKDSGIYIGQSTQIQMSQNHAFENVIGIEIENCTGITVDKNHSYNNAAGMLVVLLPGLSVTETSNITLTKNQVNNNNHVNFADPAGGFEAVVPSGSGILIVGAKNSLIKDNHVSGNNFTGIATVGTVILGALAGVPPEAFAGIDPFARNVKVIGNNVKNNGSNPPVGLPLPGVDLLWDGTGTGNCWSGNKYDTSFPSSLPACI